MKVDFSFLLKWKTILIAAGISTLLIQVIVYFHPSNMGWWNSAEFSWLNLLQFVLVDQLLIECITVTILFWLITKFTQWLKLNQVKLKAKNIILYQLSFLPLVLVAFFFFNPFTQTVRFLYLNIGQLNWDEYFDEYLFTQSLYLTYTPFVFFLTYAVINIALARAYFDHKLEKEHTHTDRLFLKVNGTHGNKLLDIQDIDYIEKQDRKYFIFSNDSSFSINKTIAELEKELPPKDFVRINRSTIVKLDTIAHYAFWENDKYVLKLNNGKEFIMSRQRLNSIKDQLKPIG